MALTDIIMPQMGESITEGTLVKWLKKEGDTVERDEPLFEISTEKVDVEIPSPSAGVIASIKVHEGDTVPVNTVVATLEKEGGASDSAPAPAAAPAAAATTAPTAPATPAAPVRADAPQSREERRRVRSSPLVRKIAREHGIELSQVAGTGISGRVTKADILGFIESGGGAAAAAAPASVFSAPTPMVGRRVPMSTMRKIVAEHMVMSRRTSAHVSTVFEADMTQVAALRKTHKASFAEKHQTKLTFTGIIAKATVRALQEFPLLNASIDGTDVVYHDSINLGIAVALDEGLIVPVIKKAEEKNLLGLQREVNDLAGRARIRKLMPDEVAGGTFTITNPGIFGGLFGLPIINQPQVAILGVGGLEKRAVVINDAIAIRLMAYLSLSFDHRLVDGAEADKFMAYLKEVLQTMDDIG